MLKLEFIILLTFQKTMLKKYIALSFVCFTLGFFACTPTTKETAINNDGNGEADTLTNFANALDEGSVITATVNGVEKEFKYLDVVLNPDPKYKAYYNRKKDGSAASISFARASHADMREKIGIFLTGLDVETMQFPMTVTGTDPERKKVWRVTYDVKKSAVPIPYYSDDLNTKITFESYKDGVLKGTFSCKVFNQGRRMLDIQNGKFEMKLDKIELP